MEKKFKSLSLKKSSRINNNLSLKAKSLSSNREEKSITYDFTNHDRKMKDLKSKMNEILTDDLSNIIINKAYSEKKSIGNYIKRLNESYVIIDDIPLDKIIKKFDLNFFNFNDKKEYKDKEKKNLIKYNEEIILSISSSVSGETDIENMYCYKKIKLENKNSDNKYELVMACIPLYRNNINDNNNEEYIRNFVDDDTITSLELQHPNLNVRQIFINNHLKDEYNNEIIKKLKYKDLINIFNDDVNTAEKVINELKNIS